MDMRSRLFAVLARLDTVELPTASLYSGAVHTRCAIPFSLRERPRFLVVSKRHCLLG
jgi:hypothetical protein